MDPVTYILENVNPTIGVPAFVTIVLILFTFPKIPLLVYARRNLYYFKVFLLLWNTVIFPSWFVFYITEKQFVTSALLATGIGILLMLLLGAISAILLFYVWNPVRPVRMPPLIENLGVRYGGYWGKTAKGECVRDFPITFWMPPLVVDGKRYYLFDYNLSSSPYVSMDPLAVDESGKIVRDAELMHRLMRCGQLADYIIAGKFSNWRSKGYRDLRKGVKALESLLVRYETLGKVVAEVEAENPERLAVMRRGLEIWMEYGRRLLQDWEAMARWEARWKWGWGLKEVKEAYVDALEAELTAFPYLWKHEEEIDRGIEAGKAFYRQFEEKQWRGKRREKKAFMAMVLLMLGAKDPIKGFLRGGVEAPTPFFGLTPRAEKKWKRRMRWARRVDRWLREIVGEGKEIPEKMYGFRLRSGMQPIDEIGRALEAKKKAWCEEHGGIG